MYLQAECNVEAKKNNSPTNYNLTHFLIKALKLEQQFVLTFRIHSFHYAGLFLLP